MEIFPTRTTLVAAIVVAFGLFTSPVEAAEVLPVPAIGDSEAVFTPGDSAGEYVAGGGNGAKAVVCRSALVEGKEGALLTGKCQEGKPASVLLSRGGFRVHAGSLPVSVVLGDAVVRLEGARLLAVRDAAGWLIKVEVLGDSGSAKMIRPQKPVVAEAAAPAEEETEDHELTAATEKKASTPVPATPIAAGKVLRVGKGGKLTVAPARAVPFLAGLEKKLSPLSNKKGPLLSARDVEIKSDFVTAASSSSAETDDIEIEDIEVEVGCVEICVD